MTKRKLRLLLLEVIEYIYRKRYGNDNDVTPISTDVTLGGSDTTRCHWRLALRICKWRSAYDNHRSSSAVAKNLSQHRNLTGHITGGTARTKLRQAGSTPAIPRDNRVPLLKWQCYKVAEPCVTPANGVNWKVYAPGYHISEASLIPVLWTLKRSTSHQGDTHGMMYPTNKH